MVLGSMSGTLSSRAKAKVVSTQGNVPLGVSLQDYLRQGNGGYANWQAGAVIIHIKRGNVSAEMISFNVDGSFVAMGKAFG
jgi:hypothetical protein